MRKIICLCLLIVLFACSLIHAEEPKVSFRYELSTMFELQSPGGTRIYIDVFDPKLLSVQPTDKDILLTTHSHIDHYVQSFADAFPGKQIRFRVGELTQGDVTVQCIPSAHNSGDPLVETNGTNYIFIIRTGGLNIVHFGDIGQDSFTPEQLKAMGKVDIALMQLSDGYSDMDVYNLKGYKLMDQLKPRMIIPTNMDLDIVETVRYTAKKWPTFFSDQPEVRIGLSDLKDKTSCLFIGPKASQFGKIGKFAKADY